jgi:hypothetical protein
VDAARRAIALRDDYVEAHSALGNALRHIGEFDEAIVSLRRAISLRPGYAIGLNNLGIALADAERLDEAIGFHRQAVAAAPGEAGMKWNMGVTLLKAGHLREGFIHHEARHEALSPKTSPRSLGKPQWDGAELAGRTILLYAEQGAGDTIQFIRYFPMVNLPGVAALALRENPMPSFDVHCPLLSLPTIFGTTLQTVPANVPYVYADPKLSQSWEGRVEAAAAGRLKIGLCWAGDPRQGNDRHRSMPAGEFAPLAKLSGVWFCNLQKRDAGPSGEPARSTAAELPPELAVTDWTAELGDFADTAALIDNLDLVVSVDTSVAHLTGAMGKRAFVLICKPGDWRWLTGRDDNPWYPTMRLFRQPRPREWGEPVARVVESINKLGQSRQA